MPHSDKKYGIILAYMGGPENKKEVRPFLANLFNDRHILNIPQPIRFLVSRLIAYSRAKTAGEHYDEIGGGSPLKKFTSRQAELLGEKLNGRGFNCTVRTGYSYSHPFIRDAVRSFKDEAVDKIIAVPLYPQYSITTFGSIADDFLAAVKKYGMEEKLKIVEAYYDNKLHIGASADLLQKALEKINLDDAYRVVFTAHSLPQSVIDKGDPYKKQVEKTVEMILQKVNIKDYVLSFQSKIGPVKWVQPSTVETIRKAASDGVKQLVVMPIGFTCDHVETLHELDIELAEMAHKGGVQHFVRAGVFNDHPQFIELLSDVVLKEINE